MEVVTETIVSNAEKTKRLFIHAIEKIGASSTELLDEIRAAKVIIFLFIISKMKQISVGSSARRYG